MGDVEKAKREVRSARMAADERRWDVLESRLKTIDEALDGVPDADKAPVLAEIAPLREKMQQGLREKNAGRIEREIRRSLSAGIDEVARGYAESPNLNKALERLASADAKQWLSAETAAKLETELADARAKMEKAAREESSGRVEREIKRSVDAAADELARGYDDSPSLKKAVDRLASVDARKSLLPEAVSRLEAALAVVQSKVKGAAPAVPAPAPAPAPTPASPPPTAATGAATPAPKPAAAAPAPPPQPAAAAATPGPALPAGADPDRARSIEGDIARTLRFGADDLSNSPERAGQNADRANVRLDSDDAKTHLPPETIQRLRAEAAALRAKADAAMRADRVKTYEETVERHLRSAESDLGHNLRTAADGLRHAQERIDKDDRKLLSPESIAKYRTEIERVRALIAAATKKATFDRAHPILEELEERVSRPIFDDSAQPWQIVGNLESLKSRVRGALSDVPAGDPDVSAIEARLAAVDTKISDASVALGRDHAEELVSRAYGMEKEAIAGWEDEKDTGEYELPKTALAVRRLRWFLADKDMGRLWAEYQDLAPVQSMRAEAQKTLETATAKLHAAFDAAFSALEKGPRPSNRIDLEEPSRFAGRLGSDFEGTKHAETTVARARALDQRWQKEIEADRAAREKKYRELSIVADAAWPAIVARIPADDEFDPQDGSVKGKTVLLRSIRNRIGWDFSGPHDFAIWVNGVPVVGNYDKTVMAAVNAACEQTELPLDDHTDWDAVITIGGRGQIKLRTEVIIKNRSNLEIGRIEEWRPVDCIQCSVIAMRAGPVAVGRT